ncbi:aldo/keto reductase [Glaciihabitans sp. dw_435]|uniref:aldo/keto reductase n=1 Tax=Glaciihabitans sp. dw_435 TaxID=2720081 RepID=UPI001BD30A75|nr:aldo/keto reductase [Glaciihabitans sp. dw_435]
MKTVRLGKSGLEISAAVLGMMSYGDPIRGGSSWALDINAARPIVRAAFDAGITTFDTSNNYSAGTSEQITGELVKELGPRENMQIFTKVFAPVRESRNAFGLSRVAILREIDASLSRLGTDYVDLYQIHRFDPVTPIEETMEALHDVVKSGKARYIGASSMWAWQFAQLQHAAATNGFTKFIAMQDQYNLLQREEEREMHPFAEATGVGVIPWAPLASGYVTRPWGADGSGRAALDQFGMSLQRDSNREIVDAVEAIASERGVPMAQVALAWVAGRSAVSAPIVGATKPHHIDDVVAGLELELTADEVQRLESPYSPRHPSGF